MAVFDKGTFGYDFRYLSDKDHSLVILTGEDEDVRVIVSPSYQAKVFTSTAEGLDGNSLGYVNYKAFEVVELNPHMNGYGGENRLWIGPEGGSFSIFFQPGAEQVYANWYTPKPFDTEAWEVVALDRAFVTMSKEMQVTNYLGNTLRLQVDREVRMLSGGDIRSLLSIDPPPKVKQVAYTTINTLINKDNFPWTRETGTVCLWLMDMLPVGSEALTIVPFHTGEDAELGKIVTSDYFGELSRDRFQIHDHLLFLKTDGNLRSKIGLNALRTKAIAGSYDPAAKRLTVCTFDVHTGFPYLNQEWNVSKDPLTGDLFNAYNDGPLEDGSLMGPFLELESASPAALLEPGASLLHRHSVFHFVGEDADLSTITETLFGISVADLKTVF